MTETNSPPALVTVPELTPTDQLKDLVRLGQIPLLVYDPKTGWTAWLRGEQAFTKANLDDAVGALHAWHVERTKDAPLKPRRSRTSRRK